jgi:UDP-N-acetylmuramoyl-tripeptide--D-alanyl-D-alanine ligase
LSRALWTATEIAAATGGGLGAGTAARSRGDWSVSGVSIDSRSVLPGELFIALRGPNHDGHDFLGQALERGASVMVDRWPADLADDALVVVVDDTMAALTALGRAGRKRSQARIAAITGSVGKTGIKEALRLALGEQAPTHASASSHNNHWGVPLSLAREPHGSVYAIYELGMNAPGEIGALTQIVRPHVALITAIAPAHLGFFDSIDAIAEAKAEIFQGLEPGGSAVLNADNEHFGRLSELAKAAGAARVIGFGASDAASARLLDARMDANGSAIAMQLDGRHLTFRVGAPGRHWVINSLAVIATAAAFGADVERAAAALAGFGPPRGRGQRRRIARPDGAITLIDDSYNANPASVRAALGVLATAPGRKLAALGDMLELGEHSAALHAELAGPIQELEIDQVFTAGPAMRHLHDALPAQRRGGHAADARALLPILEQALRDGDTLLVKGSLGSAMGQIVDALADAGPVAESAREPLRVKRG